MGFNYNPSRNPRGIKYKFDVLATHKSGSSKMMQIKVYNETKRKYNSYQLTNLYLEDELEGGECVKLVPLEIEEALRNLLGLATR